MAEVAVSRVGTVVVVRISGGPTADGADVARFDRAVSMVAQLVTNRVVVDLVDAARVGGEAVGFIRELQGRWRVRLMNAPPGVRALCVAPPEEQAG